MDIRELRKHLNLTQPEFGKLLGMGQGRVSELETGKRVPTKQMKRHLIAVETVRLLGGVDILTARIKGE